MLVCSVMFWPDLVFILQFLWQSTVEITYLISYHWNTATLFVPTYGRWIFYLFCFWIIVFNCLGWSSRWLRGMLQGGISWSISIWSWLAPRYARLAHPWPCQSFTWDGRGGRGGGTGSVKLLSLDHYIRSSFFSLRKYLGVLVSTEKF